MERKIILTNGLKFLKKHLSQTENLAFYLICEENNETDALRNYLLLLPSTYEIRASDIIEKEKFAKEYSASIHQLNLGNASRIWWAMNFTNKTPLLTRCYNNIYEYLTIIGLIEQKSYEDLVIVSSNKVIESHIRDWANKEGINLNIFISTKLNLKHILERIPLLFIFYAFLRGLLRKILSKLFLGSIFATSKKDYIIVTQFENGSFKKDGSFFDVYFGPLGTFLKKKGKSAITCGYVACAFKKIVKKATKNIQEDLVYPLEYFISFTNLFRCLKELVFNYFKRDTQIKGEVKLKGEDILRVVKKEMDIAYNTGQVFVNLLVFYSVKDLLKSFYAQKVLYPFENRSWEKMMILATRDVSKDIRLVGYQHASLTPKHINLYLEKGEYNEIPFPDEIITMGYITKDIMADLGNFPRDKLRVGCALRQSLSKNNIKRDLPGKINRILIALASSIDEYIKVLKFLDLAFSDTQHYRLIIRPHPLIDFRKALRLYKPRNINYGLDKGPLYESLNTSDLVIYASSTVSLEAISMGIPVVFIALDDVLSPDPLFNVSILKWTCKDPKELIKLIENISKIDKTVFLNLQESAREFGHSYCVPATESSMEVFI